MSDAPKRICINDFGEWYALDDGEAPGALREYIRHDAPELVALVEALRWMGDERSKQMRTADWHGNDCRCYRCAEDAVFAALAAWGKINDR